MSQAFLVGGEWLDVEVRTVVLRAQESLGLSVDCDADHVAALEGLDLLARVMQEDALNPAETAILGFDLGSVVAALHEWRQAQEQANHEANKECEDSIAEVKQTLQLTNEDSDKLTDQIADMKASHEVSMRAMQAEIDRLMSEQATRDATHARHAEALSKIARAADARAKAAQAAVAEVEREFSAAKASLSAADSAEVEELRAFRSRVLAACGGKS